MNGRRSFIYFSWNQVRIQYQNKRRSVSDQGLHDDEVHRSNRNRDPLSQYYGLAGIVEDVGVDIVDHGEKQYRDARGNHINGLEGVWGYLKRKLSLNEGIREGIPTLHQMQDVWKYNHQTVPVLLNTVQY